MDEKLKQRLVGATVLVSLAVIFVPMILAPSPESEEPVLAVPAPPKPKNPFTSRIVPVEGAFLQEGSEGGTGAAEPIQGDHGSAAGASAPIPPRQDAHGTAYPPGEGRDAESVGTAQAPGEEAADKSAEPAAATPAGLTAWAVQLGSFADGRNALRLQDQLRTKGYTAFVESAFAPEGTMTRVYVGPELERASAVAAAEKLKQELQLEGIVVRYPPQ